MSRELFKIAVCNIIKSKRKEMGLTVQQLAKGAKVCVRTLNYYEKCDDCADEKKCSLNKLMIQVRDANLNVFRNTTLEDLK